MLFTEIQPIPHICKNNIRLAKQTCYKGLYKDKGGTLAKVQYQC